MISNQVKQVPSQGSSEDDPWEENRIAQAIKEHVNQQSSRETAKPASASTGPPVEPLHSDSTPHRQFWNENRLMKVLEHLNQEKAEEGREHVAKRAVEDVQAAFSNCPWFVPPTLSKPHFSLVCCLLSS